MQRVAKTPFLRDDQTLLIGLGGNKCASSWLYDYFNWHPDCFVPAQKEQDYFLDVGIQSDLWRMRVRLKKALKEIQNYQNQFHSEDIEMMDIDEIHAFEKMQGRVYDFASNVASLTVFGDYAPNFARRDDAVKICADMSPNYSAYGLGNLDAMKAAHSQTRFMFSMRDPAERSFSDFKYHLKNHDKNMPADDKNRLEELQKFAEKGDLDVKSSYDVILDACDESIDSAHMFTCFYENLFNDETIGALCAFLDIDFVSGNYGNYVHKTDIEGHEVKMSKIEREFLVDRYKHVYKYIDERFGASAPFGWHWPSEIKTKRDNCANAG